MYPDITIGSNIIQARTLMINIGVIVSALTVFAMLFKYVKNNSRDNAEVKRNLISFVIAFALIYFLLGVPACRLVRSLTNAVHTDVLTFIKEQLLHGGEHFIGFVIIMALIMPVVFKRLFKENAANYLNIAAFFIPIQHIFSRIGCILEGCCIGVPYTGIGAVSFPRAVVSYSVFPTQHLEIALMVLLLIIMILTYKGSNGVSFGVLTTGYGISIFISEFFMDKRGSVTYANLSVVQLFAVLLFIISVINICCDSVKRISKKK